MTPPTAPRHGITRRAWLQAGYASFLGLGLASLPGRSSAAKEKDKPKRREARAKSVILVFLTGAASHIDTFDPKPDAPKEIKGEFAAIQTRTSSLRVGEHLPRLAARSDRYAVIRSFSHKENNHLVATHHVLTGHQQPGAFFDKVASRDDWPNYSSALGYLRPRKDGVPSGVNLPTFLMEGPLTWPGQHAGFLGPKYDPWQVTRDPNSPDFRLDDVRLSLEVSRLGDRRRLLEQVNKGQKSLASVAEGRRLGEKQ